MKKSIIIVAAVSAVLVVSVVGVALISGMFNAMFNVTSPPEIKEASIATGFGGGYNLETGAYDLEGTAENLGQKDAKNVTVEITFFNADTEQELKRHTIVFGDIAAETSKNVNLSIEFPSDSVRVTFRAADPVWE